MKEKPTGKESPVSPETQAAMAEAQRVMEVTTQFLMDEILVATGNDVEVTQKLFLDIINLAGAAGAVAVLERRTSAERFQADQDNHPEGLNPRQESIIYGHRGAHVINTQVARQLQERSEIIAAGKSPIQQPLPPGLPGLSKNK